MKQILLYASLLLALASCTKSSTNALENNEILRSGKWRMTAFTVKYEKSPGVDTVYDIYRNMDTCRYDDVITFGDNYKGIQYSGTDKCSSELDEIPFDWQLMNNQSVLMMNNAQYTIGNTDKIPVTPVGKEYVEAVIKKINKKSFTITYDSHLTVWVSYAPAPGGQFVEMDFHFTQTFEK